jgi:CRP/FNR family cyclic AMP-dependent transcriptional regulator
MTIHGVRATAIDAPRDRGRSQPAVSIHSISGVFRFKLKAPLSTIVSVTPTGRPHLLRIESVDDKLVNCHDKLHADCALLGSGMPTTGESIRIGSFPVPGRNMKPTFDPAVFAAKYGPVTEVRYSANQTIYAQGDIAKCIFYIAKGQAQIKIISRQRREAVLAVIEAGDFCGEGCLLGNLRRTSTATAVTDCTVFRLETDRVIRAVHDDAEFAEFFVMYILNRAVRLADDLVDHMFNSSEKRLARILLLLANYGKEGRVETVIDNADHQTLASMVGTTRSRVSTFMNKFRRLGYIDYNANHFGRIIIHKALLNAVLRDQPIGATDDAELSTG